jgi:F0F1-type ATP synthase assembly protein I
LLSGAKTETAGKKYGSAVIALQLIFITISAGVAYLTDNPQSGISIIWGGFCALMNMLLLIWRMRQYKQNIDANRHLRLMYRSALERFFVVIGLLAFGMLRLKLQPAAIILGFVLGQVAIVLVPLVRGVLSRTRVGN